MKLLTVTCLRDINMMKLQAQSIQKYLEPCEHYVIVNEDDPNIIYWHKELKKYYTTHELILLPRLPYNYERFLKPYDKGKSNQGYYLQQLLKLLFAYFIDTNYLILDSKNFFIKQTSLKQYENYTANRGITIDENTKYWYNTNIEYSKIFNTKPLTRVPIINTPFVVKKDHITNSKKINYENIDFFLNFPTVSNNIISEFLLYGYLIPENDIFFMDNYNNFPNSESITKTDYELNPIELLMNVGLAFSSGDLNKTNVIAFHYNMTEFIKQPENESFNFTSILKKYLACHGFNLD